MYRLLSCLVLLLFLSGKGNAQENHFLTFKVNPSQQKSMDFSISQVWDARLDQSSCGHFFDANLKRQIPIQMKGGLEKGIHQLFTQLYDYSGDRQVCMVVREFWMPSWGVAEEVVQLNALYDFYLQQDGRYQKLLRVDQHQENMGANPQKIQGQNTKRSLQEAIGQLAESNWSVSETPWQTKEEIMAESQDFSITKASSLTPGIYLSFQEFRQNKPSIQGVNIQIKAKDQDIISKREVQFKGLGAQGRVKNFSKSIWGFCDGERVYINNWLVFQDASFSPLQSLGSYCPFIGRESAYEMVGSSMGTLMNRTPAKRAYAFDATKGQAHLLDEERIALILKGKGNLFHQYQQERDQENPRTKMWYVSAISKQQ